MDNKILTTTSSFGTADRGPLSELESKGYTVITNPFSRRLSEEELDSLLTEYQPCGLIAGVEPITRRVLEKAQEHLRVISRVGVGWDNVDHDAVKEYGMEVFRTPDAVAPAVVELSIALIFSLARQIALHDRQTRTGSWKKHLGGLVEGKTLGVVGCGRIGRKLAEKMQCFGTEVCAFDPYVDRDEMTALNIRKTDTIEELFRDSDIVSLHLASGKDTRHLVSKNLLALMKPSALIINVARGDVINEADLSDVLANNEIAGAALDVFEQEPYEGPLRDFDNVILTPHIGSYAREARIQMEREAVENLLSALS
ncbi:MAG: hydroxyacid dehydrogenase [Myxococcales bacterium]|nr:hydroxyacid dehydrogenase [Myxococcales bacterium]|tara:strand:- start:570 stop:1505 length:936 start_codon:yes stop_codon:yes gene_type:complete